MPVTTTITIGGDNLPSPVGIGLTDLPNIGGTVVSLPPPPPSVPTPLRWVELHEKEFF